MNKVNQRESNNAKQYVELGYHSAAARTLSACIRCSLRESDRKELIAISLNLGLVNHPDWIIC